MTLNTYGHVFDELQGVERLSAEEQIHQARAKHVSVCVRLNRPQPWDKRKERKTPCKQKMGDPGLEPGTSSLSERRSDRLS